MPDQDVCSHWQTAAWGPVGRRSPASAVTRAGPWPRPSTTATGRRRTSSPGRWCSRWVRPGGRHRWPGSSTCGPAWSTSGAGRGRSVVTSVRFLALDRPTTAVLRAEVPTGHRTGPPVRAPRDADSVETGRLRDAVDAGGRHAGGHRRRRRADPCGAPDGESRCRADPCGRRSCGGRPVRERCAATAGRGRRRGHRAGGCGCRPAAGVPPADLGRSLGTRRRDHRGGRAAAVRRPVRAVPPDGLRGRRR